MKNQETKQKLKELLSSDIILDKLLNDLNWTVNDDMMTGAILVTEIKDQFGNPIQIQVRTVSRESDFYENYNDKSPVFKIDKELNLTYA